MNLNKLKKLSINKDNIMLYDYKKTSYINNNTLNINNLLNNDYDYYYVFSIDYGNKEINIDIYDNSHILFNINMDLYYNDAFNLIDAILNNKDNNLNYSIIKINK